MLITLLTDFGTRDTYVGIMKGVIKHIAPDTDIVDLTHAIPPQDIRAGAFALGTAFSYFPSGTIHVAVVDPGVGSVRAPVAVRLGTQTYVCPDNGLLTYLLAREPQFQAVRLDNPAFHLSSVSRTFHGRDIFAPVAAHLAKGTALELLGTRRTTLTTFPVSKPQVTADTIQCHVIDIDTFGNATTDLPEDLYRAWASSAVAVTVAGHSLPGPVATYSEVPEGEPLALFGSRGFLEIAVRDGSAQNHFHLIVNSLIQLSKTTI